MKKNKDIHKKEMKKGSFNDKIIKFIKEELLVNLISKIWYLFILFSIVYTSKWLFSNILNENNTFLLLFLGLFILIIIGAFFIKSIKNSVLIIIVGVILNYTVILSWGYSVWEYAEYRHEIIFLYLFINTLFTFIIALLYRTKVVLWLSIFMAFLIPFLVWDKFFRSPTN